VHRDAASGFPDTFGARSGEPDDLVGGPDPAAPSRSRRGRRELLAVDPPLVQRMIGRNHTLVEPGRLSHVDDRAGDGGHRDPVDNRDLVGIESSAECLP
jgi:hypothetical protein